METTTFRTPRSVAHHFRGPWQRVGQEHSPQHAQKNGEQWYAMVNLWSIMQKGGTRGVLTGDRATGLTGPVDRARLADRPTG